MAAYIFQASGGLPGTDEPISCEFDSIREAQAGAIRHFCELLKGHDALFWEHEEASLTVSDAVGLVLFHLNLSAIVTPSLRPIRRI